MASYKCWASFVFLQLVQRAHGHGVVPDSGGKTYCRSSWKKHRKKPQPRRLVESEPKPRKRESQENPRSV